MSRSSTTHRRLAPRRRPRQRQFGGATPNQLYSNAFPREMKVTMRYVEHLSRTPSSGFSTDYMFNLNSIFDPDLTSTGHQPYGHDQWALIYNRYRVDGAIVTVRIVGSSGGYLTILASNSVTAITSLTIAPESPLSHTLPYASGGPPCTRQITFDLAVVNGVTRAVYNADDRYQAQFGTSPSENLVLHTVWSESFGGTGTAQYEVIIDYQVTMFDLLQQSQS